MDYNYEKETLQAFRKGRLIPEKDGKPWEKEDLETLQDMYYSGADLSRIAIELSRAEHGIVAKLLEMGLLIPEHAKRNRSARKKKEGKCAGCPYQCPRKKCLKED